MGSLVCCFVLASLCLHQVRSGMCCGLHPDHQVLTALSYSNRCLRHLHRTTDHATSTGGMAWEARLMRSRRRVLLRTVVFVRSVEDVHKPRASLVP